MAVATTKHCSVCNQNFICGMGQGESACWCNAYPRIIPAESDQDCRCQSCLALAIGEHLKVSIESSSIKEMVEIARPFFDPDKLIENIDYTVDNGQTVFSSWYHLKRGECCGNGCRHCPYESAGNA